MRSEPADFSVHKILLIAHIFVRGQQDIEAGLFGSR